MDPCKYGFGRPRNAVLLMVYPYLDWAAIWLDFTRALAGFYKALGKYLPRAPEIMPEIVPDPPLRSAQIILVFRNKEFFIVLGNPRPQADLRRGSGSPLLTYLP